MVERVGRSPDQLVTVRRACAEGGFYAIPTAELAAESRDDHDPERVEALFARIESDAAVVIDGILGDHVLPSRGSKERVDLALLIAQQMTRGWGFRARMDEIVTRSARDRLSGMATPERVRNYLLSRGEAASQEDVEAFQRQVHEGEWHVRFSQTAVVQQGLRVATDHALPEILSRDWRVKVFDEPILLTSDEPVVPWSPGPDGSTLPGLGNARTYWWPLDRHHLLSMSQGGGEMISGAPLTRARQVNRLVAQNAHRWIYHHPQDEGLAGAELPSPVRWVEETADVLLPDTEVRELRRPVRRSPSFGTGRTGRSHGGR